MSGGYSEDRTPGDRAATWAAYWATVVPYIPGYADLAPCGRCGKDVVLDHDPPCPEGYAACPECTHAAVCVDCKLRAEQDMYESGKYDAAKDPFYDHTARIEKS